MEAAQDFLNDLPPHTTQQSHIEAFKKSLDERQQQFEDSAEEKPFLETLQDKNHTENTLSTAINNALQNNTADTDLAVLRNHGQMTKLKDENPKAYTELLLALHSSDTRRQITLTDSLQMDLNMVTNTTADLLRKFLTLELENTLDVHQFTNQYYSPSLQAESRTRLTQAMSTANLNKLTHLLSKHQKAAHPGDFTTFTQFQELNNIPPKSIIETLQNVGIFTQDIPYLNIGNVDLKTNTRVQGQLNDTLNMLNITDANKASVKTMLENTLLNIQSRMTNRKSINTETKNSLSDVSNSQHTKQTKEALIKANDSLDNQALNKLQRIVQLSRNIYLSSNRNQNAKLDNTTRELTHTLSDLKDTLLQLVIKDSSGKIISNEDLEKLIDSNVAPIIQLMNAVNLLSSISEDNDLTDSESSAIRTSLQNLRPATLNELLKPENKEATKDKKKEIETFLEQALTNPQAENELKPIFANKTTEQKKDRLEKILNLTADAKVTVTQTDGTQSQESAENILLKKTRFLESASAEDQRNYLLLKAEQNQLIDGFNTLKKESPNDAHRHPLYNLLLSDGTTQKERDQLPLTLALLSAEDAAILPSLDFLKPGTGIQDLELLSHIKEGLPASHHATLETAYGRPIPNLTYPNTQTAIPAGANTEFKYQVQKWAHNEQTSKELSTYLQNPENNPQITAEIIANIGLDPSTSKHLSGDENIFTGIEGEKLALRLTNRLQTHTITLSNDQFFALMKNPIFKEIFTSHPRITETIQKINPTLSGRMLYESCIEKCESKSALPRLTPKQFEDILKIANEKGKISTLYPLLIQNMHLTKSIIEEGLLSTDTSQSNISSRLISMIDKNGQGQAIVIDTFNDILKDYTATNPNFNKKQRQLTQFIQNVYLQDSFMSESNQTTRDAMYNILSTTIDLEVNIHAGNTFDAMVTDRKLGIPNPIIQDQYSPPPKQDIDSTISAELKTKGQQLALQATTGEKFQRKAIFDNFISQMNAAETKYIQAKTKSEKQIARLNLTDIQNQHTAFLTALAKEQHPIPTGILKKLSELGERLSSQNEKQAFTAINEKIASQVQDPKQRQNFTQTLKMLSYLQGRIIQPKLNIESFEKSPDFKSGNFTMISKEQSEKIYKRLLNQQQITIDGTLKEPINMQDVRSILNRDGYKKEEVDHVIKQLHQHRSLSPSTAHQKLVNQTLSEFIKKGTFKTKEAISNILNAQLNNAQKENLLKLMMSSRSHEKEAEILLEITHLVSKNKVSAELAAKLTSHALSQTQDRHHAEKQTQLLKKIIVADVLNQSGILTPLMQELDRNNKAKLSQLKQAASAAIKEGIKNRISSNITATTKSERSLLQSTGQAALKILKLDSALEFNRLNTIHQYLDKLLMTATLEGDQATTENILGIQNSLRGKESRSTGTEAKRTGKRLGTAGIIGEVAKDIAIREYRGTGADIYHNNHIGKTVFASLANITQESFSDEMQLPTHLSQNERNTLFRMLVSNGYLYRTKDNHYTFTTKAFPPKPSIDWKTVLPNLNPQQHHNIQEKIAKRIEAPKLFLNSFIKGSAQEEFISQEILSELTQSKKPHLQAAAQFMSDYIVQETKGTSSSNKGDKRLIISEHYLKQNVENTFQELIESNPTHQNAIWSAILPTSMNEEMWSRYQFMLKSKKTPPKKGISAQLAYGAKLIDRLIQKQSQNKDVINDQLLIAYQQNPRLVESRLRNAKIDKTEPFNALITAREKLGTELHKYKKIGGIHPLIEQLGDLDSMTYTETDPQTGQTNKKPIPRHLVLMAFNSFHSSEYHTDAHKDFMTHLSDKGFDAKKTLLRGMNPQNKESLDNMQKALKKFEEIQYKTKKDEPIQSNPLQNPDGLEIALQNYDGNIPYQSLNTLFKNQWEMEPEARRALIEALYGHSSQLITLQNGNLYIDASKNTEENWENIEQEMVKNGLATKEQIQTIKALFGPVSKENIMTQLNLLFTDFEGHINTKDLEQFLKSQTNLSQKSCTEITYRNLKKGLQSGTISPKSLGYAREQLNQVITDLTNENIRPSNLEIEALYKSLDEQEKDLLALKSLEKEYPNFSELLNSQETQRDIQRATQAFFNPNKPEHQDLYTLSQKISDIFEDAHENQPIRAN